MHSGGFGCHMPIKESKLWCSAHILRNNDVHPNSGRITINLTNITPLRVYRDIIFGRYHLWSHYEHGGLENHLLYQSSTNVRDISSKSQQH